MEKNKIKKVTGMAQGVTSQQQGGRFLGGERGIGNLFKRIGFDGLADERSRSVVGKRKKRSEPCLVVILTIDVEENWEERAGND